jgi:hypothetical protein
VQVLSSAKAVAEREAREAVEAAEAQVRRIVEEGMARREDIEAVIADLVRRRDDVLTDTEELSAKLTGAVSEHRPEPGTDEFSKPEEYDPLAREGAELPDEPNEEDTAIADAETHEADAETDEAESEHEADLRR